MSCWALYAKNISGNTVYTRYFCAQSAEFQPSEVAPSGSGGVKVVFVDSSGVSKSLFVEALGVESWLYPTSQLVSASGGQKPELQGTEYGDCSGCVENLTSYDCLNGACVSKNQYLTPGLYPTLSACEKACGTGCSGKCLSNNDWAQITGLAAQLKNKNCS